MYISKTANWIITAYKEMEIGNQLNGWVEIEF